MRDRYDIRADYPEFDAVQEHHCRYIAMTADDGRYIVMTDSSGSDYPSADDYQVCVYKSEDDFCEDPTDSLLDMFTPANSAHLDDALLAAEFAYGDAH
jgi:hypothetical protein